MDVPHQHPFFQLKLDELYPHEYALPWHPAVEPLQGPINPLYQAFLSNKIQLPAEVQFYSKLSARVRQHIEESSFESYKTRVLLRDNRQPNSVVAPKENETAKSKSTTTKAASVTTLPVIQQRNTSPTIITSSHQQFLLENHQKQPTHVVMPSLHLS